MLPFACVDAWWHSGFAAAPASALCFIAGGVFLFAAARRIFRSTPAAAAATALAACNPNLLYLQSTAMTEPVFFAALMALLYFTARFRDTPGWGSIAGAGLAACAATLTRYDGWFLLPFAAAYFLYAGSPRRALLFSLLAATGPLWWMAHGWYETGDALDFYRGPYTAFAIQGSAPYPGRGNWHMAWYYYHNAVQLCAGPVLALLAIAGPALIFGSYTVSWLRPRTRGASKASPTQPQPPTPNPQPLLFWPLLLWPLLLLALPGVFFIWSMHKGAVPIFMPHLWPFSWYNTRYGLAVLPLLALAAATLVTAVPKRFRAAASALLVLAAIAPWLAHPSPEHWITWAESRANSEGRRAWMHEAAAYLAPLYVPGSGIISSSGDDFFGIYREMGIPLRETFSVCNGLPWDATLARPDLFLWQEWAVVRRGDPVQTAIGRAARYGIRYRLELSIIKKDEPVIEIYRRIGDSHGQS